MDLDSEEGIKNDRWEEDEDKEIKNEQKSLLIILASLVILSTAVVLGIFLFFPLNFQDKSPLILKDTSAQEPSLSESNHYVSQLHQQKNEEKSQSSSPDEEFFIEIFPKEEKNTIHANNLQPLSKISPSSSSPTDDIVTSPPIPQESSKSFIKKETKTKTFHSNKEVKSPNKKPFIMTKEKAKPSKSIDTFWVQIGSFSEEKLAEAAIAQLKLEGFEAKKLTFNNGKITFTRVRLGPYDKKSEADKFLGWVKEIKGFNESYVIKSNR